MGLDISLYIERNYKMSNEIIPKKIREELKMKDEIKTRVRTEIGDFRKNYPLYDKVCDYLGRDAENCEYVNIDVSDFRQLLKDLLEDEETLNSPENDYLDFQFNKLKTIYEALEGIEPWDEKNDYTVVFWAWW